MKLKKEHKRIEKKYIVKLCIVSIISMCISLSLPIIFEKTENFTYTLGTPWAHETLIAPMTFSIEKSPKKFEMELDSIRNNFAPYYIRDTEKEQLVIQSVKQAMRSNIFSVTDSLFREVVYAVTQLYRTGICSIADYENITANKTDYIKVYNNTQAQQIDKKKIHDTKNAYISIISGIKSPIDKKVIQECNLDKHLEPNLNYDMARSEQELADLLDKVSRYKGQVVEGQKIIDYGTIVDEETYQIIQSLENKIGEVNYSKEYKRTTIFGEIIFCIVAFAILGIFLCIYRPTVLKNNHKLLLIFTCITFSQVITGAFTIFTNQNIYILPFTMSAIVLRIFMDSRTAFMTYLIQILMTSLLFCSQAEFIILQLSTGLLAVYSMHELSQRSQLFKSTVLILITYSILYLGTQLIHLESISSINYKMFFAFCINAALLLFTYPLLFIVEKIFGFASNVTLVELSNINHPLLRELSESAPGTFQHSMQVSVLAAEGANAIGANAQFARTGALYHDIGKMKSPVYFTENQKGKNPHDMINNEESAKIIISHVTQGLELADKFKLPSLIKDCIAQHHGTGVVKYFYLSSVNNNPGVEINKEPFTYPGPAPRYKETAILMMADAVEAASRSLKDYSEDSISELVEHIINGQVADHMFDFAPITLLEISMVKKVFKEKLKSINHTRISYPNQR